MANTRYTYNIVEYGARGNDTTDDYSVLYRVLALIGTTASEIYFPPGTYVIGSNVTIPANVTINLAGGAILSPSTGVTLTLNGCLNAMPTTAFAGAGTVVLSGNVPLFYPQWWGATGDGVTDDTTALQSALTAAGTAGGRVVFVPAGTYIISVNLLVSDYTTVRGVGRRSIIKWGSGSALHIFRNLLNSGSGATGNGLRFEHLYLDGGAQANSGTGGLIRMRGVNGLDVHHCTLVGGSSVGIAHQNGTNGKVTNCTLLNIGQEGIDFAGSTHCLASHNYLENIGGDALTIYHTVSLTPAATCDNCGFVDNEVNGTIRGHGVNVGLGSGTFLTTNFTIVGNRLKGCGGAGIRMMHGSQYGTVTGNTIQGSAGYGISVDGATSGVNTNEPQSLVIASNTLTGCGDGSHAGIAVLATTISLRYLRIVNNVVRASSGIGIWLRAGGAFTLDRVFLSGNAVSNSGQTSVNTLDNVLIQGVTLGILSNIIFARNDVFDDQGTKSARYGLNVNTDGTGVFTNVRIEDNTLSPGSTAATNGMTTATTILNNIGYVTENNGVATIANGTVLIAVNHGLGRTPALKDIVVTPTNNMGSATKFFISTPTSSQFTINVDINPGVTTATFAWTAGVR